jgi:hypothetical protein
MAAKLVKPKLVLQTTVDQLRGDLPAHSYNRPGGRVVSAIFRSQVSFTVDNAPTLSMYLEINPPAGAQETPLKEVPE